MKFYDRAKEVALLRELKNSKRGAKIVVITGRRRIGKTRLVLEALGEEALYFFAKKKGILELLREWEEELRRIGDFYGRLDNFEDFLKALFSAGEGSSLTAVFDEVQNLYSIFPEAFATFQKVFDMRKENSNLLLVFTGSVYSLMEKIFRDSREPLFGRASEIIYLSYLPLKAQEEILRDYKMFSGENLLHLFSIFDGIPFYIEELVESGGRGFKGALKKLIVERDLLWEEGENALKNEMGKEYSSYYSILSAIAKGRRTRNEISQYTGIKELGGYLSSLERTYRLIERRTSIFKGKESKLSRYYIKDNFLEFWFRFLDRYSNYKELGQKERAFEKIWEELPAYEGRKLEELVLRKIIEENSLGIEFDTVGKYWDRKGKIEVDLILLNRENKVAYAFEIKRKKNKILRGRAEFLSKLNEVIGELKGFKMVPVYAWVEKDGVKIAFGVRSSHLTFEVKTTTHCS